MTVSGLAGPVNWDDPCQRAAALNAAYYSLLSGQREIEVRTRTLDAEELVRFQATDLKTLWVELISAQAECARAQGLPDPNRRFAITGGSRSDMPAYNRMRRPL